MKKIDERLSEKDVEDLIMSLTKDDLVERGLSCFNHQFVIQQPNFGPFGKPDWVGYTYYSKGNVKCVDVTVYELKRDQLTTKTICQASRYLCASIQDLSNKGFRVNGNIVLIGDWTDGENEFWYLCFLLNISVFTYSLKNEELTFQYMPNRAHPDSICDSGKCGVLDFNHIHRLY